MYGPVSSHPSRTGDSIEPNSPTFADFFFPSWNTPTYIPVSVNYGMADGSVRVYGNMDLMMGIFDDGTLARTVHNKGLVLPKELGR